MSLARAEIADFLTDEFMSQEDNHWTVWYGADEATATQLLNRDGSNVYVWNKDVTPEIMAYDSTIDITTEVYKILWVQQNPTDKPDASAGWWLSLDGGTTKEKVSFIKKRSRGKRSRWHIFLKRG